MAVRINAGSLKVGFHITYEGKLCRVMAMETVKPGKGGAFAQLKLRYVEQGNQTDVRLRTEEKVERAVLEQKEMEYLYEDTSGHCFMDSQTYEQEFLSPDVLGSALDYLLPNTKVSAEYYDGRLIGIELPRMVELTITDTAPVMKTATITSSPKPATLETGLVVSVPQFVESGEKIRVDTAEGKYVERVK